MYAVTYTIETEDKRESVKLKDRLAELRRQRGLTLRELRERIEQQADAQLSISYLSELERVDTMPSIEILLRIAQGYGISLHDLLAPVDFFETATEAQYPESLREFAREEDLSPEWVEALSRIEFRGQRPESVSQWRAIYSVLKLSMEMTDRS